MSDLSGDSDKYRLQMSFRTYVCKQSCKKWLISSFILKSNCVKISKLYFLRYYSELAFFLISRQICKLKENGRNKNVVNVNVDNQAKPAQGENARCAYVGIKYTGNLLFIKYIKTAENDPSNHL